jgi:hypothetical protein
LISKSSRLDILIAKLLLLAIVVLNEPVSKDVVCNSSVMSRVEQGYWGLHIVRARKNRRVWDLY